MRIDRLSIKGITTFKDEAVLDLSAIGPGLIAIAGPNGAGKSSLLEAIPGGLYRQTPSRGAIAGLATARDSQIEIVGVNGVPFTARLDIDAHTGKSEAILIDGAGAPIAGPKVKDFDRVIAEKFPPFNVYLAAAFSCQTGAGSLLKMDRADRRALFGRLLGLERLEELATAARERARKAESEVIASRAALEALQGQAEDVAALEQELSAAKANAATAKGLQEAAQAELDGNIRLLDVLKAAQAEVKNAEARLTNAMRRMDSAAGEVVRLESRLAGLKELLAKAPEIRAIAEKIKAAAAELEKNRAAGESAAAEDRRLQDLAREAESMLAATKVTADQSALALKESGLQLKEADAAIANAKASTGAVPCAGALDDTARGRCPALAGHFRNRAKAEDTIRWYVDNIAKIKDEVARTAQAVVDAQVKAKVARDNAAASRIKIDGLRAEYRRIAWELDHLRARDRTAEIDKAEAESAALKESLATAGLALEDSKVECARIRAEMPVVDSADIAKVEKCVRELSESFADLKRCCEKDSNEAVRLETRLKAAVQVQAKTEELIAKIGPAEREIADWKFIARGLGREGVQALELDAAGPRVSELANELLADAYGPRFQLRFETQAAKADGKGVKETFDIVVVDNEAGREGNGEDLSGGEKVIVGEALGLAVGLFHAQASGIELGTVVRDETAGALYPETRPRYVSMLRQFMKIGRIHQLLFVAHDYDIIDLADAVVRIDNGRIQVN